MMRTRNFRFGAILWKEDQSPKVETERKPTWEDSGECFQWRHMDNVPKETHSLSHDTIASGNWRGPETKKDDRLLRIAFEGKADRLTASDKKPSNESSKKEESSSDRRSEIPCRYRIWKKPSCKFWHPPVCQNKRSEKGYLWRQNPFRHVQAAGKRKEVQKDQLRCWMNLYNWVVYLKILIRESLFYVNLENLGSKHAANFSKGTWHQIF